MRCFPLFAEIPLTFIVEIVMPPLEGQVVVMSESWPTTGRSCPMS